jgi:MFS family permease
MMALQAVLILGPQDPALLGLLWLGFAFAGSCGPATYSVLAQRFPPEMTGRVATAMNGSMLALVFVAQNAIGWVLDFWPRNAEGGWHRDGYAWALGLTLAGQVLTVAWLLAAPRLRARRG